MTSCHLNIIDLKFGAQEPMFPECKFHNSSKVFVIAIALKVFVVAKSLSGITHRRPS